MNAIQSLLLEVEVRATAVREAGRRYAAQLAPDFSLMNYLANGETALSRYLAMLLDPDGMHGQGDLFLRTFFERFYGAAEWATPSAFQGISLEHPTTAGRRLDIFMQFHGGLVGVENKPWAADQVRQLHDYADFLESRALGKHWLLVYVCNEEPSEESISQDRLRDLVAGGRFLRITFHDVVDWLDYCAAFTRAPTVRIFVEELVRFVRGAINGEPAMAEQNEVMGAILKSEESLRSAFLVASSMDKLKQELLSSLHADLKAAFQELPYALIWEEAALARGSAYAGFGVLLHPDHKVVLRLEFGATRLTGLEWGICRRSREISLDPTKSDVINTAMGQRFGAGMQGDNWPWYPQPDNDPWLRRCDRDWMVNAEPWLLIRDKGEDGFVQRFVGLTMQVADALKNCHQAMC
jgi:hypothetical protein